MTDPTSDILEPARLLQVSDLPSDFGRLLSESSLLRVCKKKGRDATWAVQQTSPKVAWLMCVSFQRSGKEGKRSFRSRLKEGEKDSLRGKSQATDFRGGSDEGEGENERARGGGSSGSEQ